MKKLLRNLSVWGILLSIILVAACLRLYQLGQVPHGMAWDEAAIGYNGYAVITKRRDEWLQKLPVSFKSFGDYKAPLAIYLNGPFTWALGMELWVVRLPFALAGIVAVGLVALLFFELWPAKYPISKSASMIAGATLITLSPWHLHYSRVAFESGLALAFLLAGVLGMTWLTKTEKLAHPYQRLAGFLLMVAGLVSSMYTYHSAKIVVPLLCLVFFGVFWSRFWKQWKAMVLAALLSAGALWPLVSDTLWGPGSARFEQASILAKGYSWTELSQVLWRQLLLHLQPSFLVGGAETTLRHGDGVWGVLLPTTFLLVLIGLVWGWRVRTMRSWWIIFGAWTLIGLLPAVIGIDVPHSNRSLLALPGFLGLAVLGLARLMDWAESTPLNTFVNQHSKNGTWPRLVLGMGILVHCLLSLAQLNHYYTIFARESAPAFSDGYLEAFEYVIPYEKGLDGKKKVDLILFSNYYGQPYIYALFARRTDPIWFNGGSLNTYQFVNKTNASDLERPNTLVVGTPADDLPIEKADKIVYGSDGAIRFLIYVPK